MSHFYCHQCKKTISEKVYNYSMKYYSEALCMRHQKNKDGAEVDKIIHVSGNIFFKAWEKGGIGLLLMAIGTAITILSIIMQLDKYLPIGIGFIVLGIIWIIFSRKNNKN